MTALPEPVIAAPVEAIDPTEIMTTNEYLTSIKELAEPSSAKVRDSIGERVKTKANKIAREKMLKRNGDTGRICERFADGKWWDIGYMAEQLDLTVADLTIRLNNMSRPQVAVYERQRDGKSEQVRLFPLSHSVSILELTTKLRPLIQGLKAEGIKKHAAFIAPATVARIAVLLQRQLDEWSK